MCIRDRYKTTVAATLPAASYHRHGAIPKKGESGQNDGNIFFSHRYVNSHYGNCFVVTTHRARMAAGPADERHVWSLGGK